MLVRITPLQWSRSQVRILSVPLEQLVDFRTEARRRPRPTAETRSEERAEPSLLGEHAPQDRDEGGRDAAAAGRREKVNGLLKGTVAQSGRARKTVFTPLVAESVTPALASASAPHGPRRAPRFGAVSRFDSVHAGPANAREDYTLSRSMWQVRVLSVPLEHEGP